MTPLDPGRVYLCSMGLVYATVCAPAGMPPEDVTAAVSTNRPWVISDDPFEDGPNPGPCDAEPDRLHYLLNC